MKHLIFYGVSDDLVEVRGFVDEEYSLPNGDRASFQIVRPNGVGVRVIVAYESGGVWSVGLSPLDEVEDGGNPWPDDWGFSTGHAMQSGEAPPCSAVLTVAFIDDDAELVFEQGEG